MSEITNFTLRTLKEVVGQNMKFNSKYHSLDEATKIAARMGFMIAELREEAIKWIKEIKEKDGYCLIHEKENHDIGWDECGKLNHPTLYRCPIECNGSIQGAVLMLMKFFNITEEELRE